MHFSRAWAPHPWSITLRKYWTMTGISRANGKTYSATFHRTGIQKTSPGHHQDASLMAAGLLNARWESFSVAGPRVSELRRGPRKASALAKTTRCYSVLGTHSLSVPWSLPQARRVCIVPSKSGWLLAIWARTLNKGPQLKGHHLPLKPTLFPPQCPAQHLHFSSKIALPALGQTPRFPAAGSTPNCCVTSNGSRAKGGGRGRQQLWWLPLSVTNKIH